MKTLTLISAGIGKPEPEELERRERADETPRATLFEKTLESDMLDERYFHSLSPVRRRVYGTLPVHVAQVIEAYRVYRRYDAIISWAEHLGLPLAGLLKVTGARIPHVCIFSWISKRKKAHLLKRVYSHIDRLILMSSVQRDFAINNLGIPASRITFLRWAVDQKFWRPMDVPSTTICSVGREMRDYATLIEAMRGLDIPCHIAAGGIVAGKNDAWKARANGTVPRHVTVGRKSFSDLRALYACSRFVVIPVLPTDTDNGTTSILEAMAMGKTVICSQVEGQKDVIVEGKTGLFVPPRDPRALRDAIHYLWTNPDVAEGMGRAARTYVEQHHTLDQWLRDVKRVVADVITEHKEGAAAGEFLRVT